MVPSITQMDIIPLPNVSVHAVDLDNQNLAWSSVSPFPGLGNIAVSSGMDQLCDRDNSNGIGNMSPVSDVSTALFSLRLICSFLFWFCFFSSFGFASFPLRHSSSLPFSSSSFGISTIAPSFPPPCLSIFSLLRLFLLFSLSLLLIPPPTPRVFCSSLFVFSSVCFSLRFSSHSSFPVVSAPALSYRSISFSLFRSSSGLFLFFSFCSSLGFCFVSGLCVRSFCGVSGFGSLVCSFWGFRFSFLSFLTSLISPLTLLVITLLALRSPASASVSSFPPPLRHGYPSSSLSLWSSLPRFGIPSHAPASSFPPPPSSSDPVHYSFPSQASLSSFGHPQAPFPEFSSLPQFSGFPSASSSFPSTPPVALGLGHLPGAPVVLIVPAAPAVPAPHPLFRLFVTSLPSSARVLPLSLNSLRMCRRVQLLPPLCLWFGSR